MLENESKTKIDSGINSAELTAARIAMLDLKTNFSAVAGALGDMTEEQLEKLNQGLVEEAGVKGRGVDRK